MMKHALLLFSCFLLHHVIVAQGVSVNGSGTAPDASAMLDIQSTSKGVLIPRMTTAQRTGITTPATGLLVFDTNTASFWYRHSTGWKELTDDFHGLRDADNDTKVQVEESPDEDVIRFDIGGDEALVINKSTQGATRLDVGPELNLIIGRNAGLTSFSGWNTFVGPNAGQFNTTGQNNVFVGYRAGEDNAAQNRNVFIGTESGANNIGGFNTFAGYRTGYVNSTGHSNVFLGNEAGVQNTTGFRNTFIGYVAGHNNEITDENTFVGNSAGYNNEADRNTFLGYEAGMANRTGLYNVVLGGEAAGTNLSNRDMGNGNSIIGYEAGQVANGLTENVLLGYRAGYSMTNGLRNIFIGANSGLNTLTASSNVAVGYHALRFNLTGSRNIAIGDSSLYSNTAHNNVALGFKSGMDNTTGHSNTFLGYLAGTNNIGGNQNTFIGAFAGENNTTGGGNAFIGKDAGKSNVSGNDNLFLGNGSGYFNEGGNENIFLGRQAGDNNLDGFSNIAIGSRAGSQNNDGNHNIAIGELALGDPVNSPVAIINNIALGFRAGEDATGNSNIIIGNESGQSVAGSNNVLLGNDIVSYGSNNTFLGSGTSALLSSPNGATAIGYGATISQNNSIILGEASNTLVKVGIGTTSPDMKLHIEGEGFDLLKVTSNGNNAFRVLGNRDVIVDHELLINTTTGKPGYEVSVNGQIACEEVLVQASEAWPDYVFAEDYSLMDFKALRTYLQQNQHMPGIPSAKEVAANGVKVGDMQKRLLEKIEEMTLYILQLESRIDALENK